MWVVDVVAEERCEYSEVAFMVHNLWLILPIKWHCTKILKQIECQMKQNTDEPTKTRANYTLITNGSKLALSLCGWLG